MQGVVCEGDYAVDKERSAQKNGTDEKLERKFDVGESDQEIAAIASDEQTDQGGENSPLGFERSGDDTAEVTTVVCRNNQYQGARGHHAHENPLHVCLDLPCMPLRRRRKAQSCPVE